jgi:glutamate-1-semialdehyde 2,1-aminomutase
MTAGLTAMKLFGRDQVEQLNSLGERCRHQIADAIRVSGIEACVTGAGSMFRIHLKPDVPQNYRQAYVSPAEAKRIKLLLDYAIEHGVVLINTCSGTLSTPMTPREIDVLCDILLGAFRKLRELS